MSFQEHVNFQVRNGVLSKARELQRDQKYGEVIACAMQFAFNLGAVAVFESLPKERGYDRMAELKQSITVEGSLEERAQAVLSALEKVSAEE